MARKPALSTDKLKDLGADKLAQLVFEEAERNAGSDGRSRLRWSGNLALRLLPS